MAGKIAEFGKSPIEDAFAVAQGVAKTKLEIDFLEEYGKESNMNRGAHVIAVIEHILKSDDPIQEIENVNYLEKKGSLAPVAAIKFAKKIT